MLGRWNKKEIRQTVSHPSRVNCNLTEISQISDVFDTLLTFFVLLYTILGSNNHCFATNIPIVDFYLTEINQM